MSLALLKQAASRPIEDYDPGEVIGSVNYLQQLGKLRALAVLEELLTTPGLGETSGLFWVLRVLFDVPAGVEFPPVRLGQPSIPPPADVTQLRRYPIVIAQDVPFLAIRGYLLGGLPEAVETHIEYFRANGEIRTGPLAPATSFDVIEEDFVRQWRAAYGEAFLREALDTVRQQLRRLPGSARV